MKYIDLFGGIGGFSYGIKQANNKKHTRDRRGKEGVSTRKCSSNIKEPPHKDWECVWYCDQDKYSVQTYNKNFGTNYEPTDISSIRTKDIPDHDIICAGFPCQSFSLAGKRRGFEDVRGTMFFEIMRIAKAKRTKYLFLENVKGLLNHDKGKTFTTIIQTLEELGYNTQWMVLNSKFFGVPQNRERVFIIGSLRGESRPEILPFGEDAREIPGVSQDKGVEKGKEEKIMFDMYNKNMRAECPTLLEPHHNSIALWQMRVGHTKSEYSPNQYKSNVTRTLEASGNLSVFDENKKTYTFKAFDGSSKEDGRAIREHKVKGESSCLTSQMGMGGNNVPMINAKESPTLTTELAHTSGNFTKNWIKKGFLRRLTPIECERLQGFPDNWTEGVSDTQRYKQCGNAVTTNVITAIVRRWNEKDNTL